MIWIIMIWIIQCNTKDNNYNAECDLATINVIVDDEEKNQEEHLNTKNGEIQKAINKLGETRNSNINKVTDSTTEYTSNTRMNGTSTTDICFMDNNNQPYWETPALLLPPPQPPPELVISSSSYNTTY